ncbi:MAG: peptide deformylase [Aeriscardovia sp.]|nr:peptide deformylase [Aeriscardovia sp.]MBQ1357345.1 peptide deformylase [Aeriscardovia sp.]MBQ5493139.1 peptide deformylase [Aeriscardovia sp.]MBQ5520678.1 peptide deformylase [Aeriscardovia sp.]MBQ5762526.1 peptide deformylase [Aeriscardovia sp.]
MALLTINTVPDPVLRTKCEEVERIDESVRDLVRDMLETVDDPGRAGLSANQVGVLLRIFTYNVGGKLGYLINPRITYKSGQQDGEEGCLSLPGLWFSLQRSSFARAEGIDLDGKKVIVEGKGLMARMIQHECDHLDGHLFTDRLEGKERARAQKAIRNI